uniref:SRCR domain-containing protein n=1 Tax=Myripristis murdjan TaxID=586833 RepID=A0A668ABT0_9TELE
MHQCVRPFVLTYMLLQRDDVRLVEGAGRCAGTLEVNQNKDWKPVDSFDWNLKSAAASVRLVNGNSLCSGRVEVKSDQSWSSVCEADFDQQDAQVLCRELGCGPPSVLQGALYGEAEAPMWTKEFQCEGSESSLLDCGSSGSARNTCSPGKAVGLTCSEPDVVRLVGGTNQCAGRLEMKQYGEWKAVDGWDADWNLQSAAAVCRELDCGSAVSTERRRDSSERSGWDIKSSCLQSGSTLRECVETWTVGSFYKLEITCSVLDMDSLGTRDL